MISRVLDLSEIEAERVELRATEIDLRGLARSCLDIVRPAAEAKHLALIWSTAANLPANIKVDATRLRQVLVNLLGNAVKFTQHGSVTLRLKLSPDGLGLMLEVADTGPGIPAERRHQLFRDFERLGEAALPTTEGAGLGLAISSHLATLMGGSLSYEDNPAGGSVFSVKLPLSAIAVPSIPPLRLVLPKPDAFESAEALPSLHVLVVDDVAMNRDIARAFLCAAGHEVTTAENGTAAITAAAAADFDIVLMDVRMPGMDGLEATRRIRALSGSRGMVPIIALTAQAFAEQMEQCHEAGMDSHLTKPFTPDSLRQVLVQCARMRAPEHALQV